MAWAQCAAQPQTAFLGHKKQSTNWGSTVRNRLKKTTNRGSTVWNRLKKSTEHGLVNFPLSINPGSNVWGSSILHIFPHSSPLCSVTHSTTTLKKPKDYNNNTFQCWTTQSCDLAKIPGGAALMIMMRRRRELSLSAKDNHYRSRRPH